MPQNVHTFSSIVGSIIPKSVKCIHSATESFSMVQIKRRHPPPEKQETVNKRNNRVVEKSIKPTTHNPKRTRRSKALKPKVTIKP